MNTTSERSKCQYIHCNNGKHNNSKLFSIPIDLDRQKLWIECSGTFLNNFFFRFQIKFNKKNFMFNIYFLLMHYKTFQGLIGPLYKMFFLI